MSPPTSAVLTACWRVFVSTAPTLPSLGLANMLISAANNRVNMPRETGHFLSFSLIYIFSWKTAVKKTLHLTHWRGGRRSDCAHLCLAGACERDRALNALELYLACSSPHQGLHTCFSFIVLSRAGSSPERRSTPPTLLPEPHHCSLPPSSDGGRGGCLPSQASPSSSFNKTHSPSDAFLFPSP